MKRFLLLISVMVAFIIPIKVLAATATYGLTVEESKWQTKDDGGKYFTQTYYVTSTNNGFVFIDLLEAKNVKIDVSTIVEGSSFTLVDTENVNVTYNNASVPAVRILLKLKDGVSLSGKTELFTVVVNIVDPSVLECSLPHSPLNLSCQVFKNHYFDDKGREVSQEDYVKACSNTTPPVEDVPNTPETGSVIPYIAIGIGLVIVGGGYAYIRKSNKMFKI